MFLIKKKLSKIKKNFPFKKFEYICFNYVLITSYLAKKKKKIYTIHVKYIIITYDTLIKLCFFFNYY